MWCAACSPRPRGLETHGLESVSHSEINAAWHVIDPWPAARGTLSVCVFFDTWRIGGCVAAVAKSVHIRIRRFVFQPVASCCVN